MHNHYSLEYDWIRLGLSSGSLLLVRLQRASYRLYENSEIAEKKKREVGYELHYMTHL